jgi:ATP-dependent RNA helicase DDX46/PRP5
VLRLPLEVVVGERSSVNKDITQVVEVHDDADKFMRLLQLLGVWYEKGQFRSYLYIYVYIHV